MTKAIWILIIVVAVWVAWIFFEHGKRVYSEQDLSQQEAEKARAALAAMNPRDLPGIPDKMKDSLENSLDKARIRGAAGLREWLKQYRKVVQDPRLAWIELDYVVLVSRDDPQEAKKVFAAVKDRTPPTSPVWPRVQQLEKTYE